MLRRLVALPPDPYRKGGPVMGFDFKDEDEQQTQKKPGLEELMSRARMTSAYKNNPIERP